MSLLLNIDTATPYASVGISNNGALLDMVVSDSQKEHAAFLQPAIAKLAQSLQLSLQEVDAIALTIGPGSYTGLRVGLSSAKGLAYALGKPLIAVNTLEVMAYAARSAWTGAQAPASNTGGPVEPALFCPMIDARRNEVFTAIYDQAGTIVAAPQALVLEPAFFETYEINNYLIFSGDGSNKWKTAYSSNKARFLFIQHSVADLAPLAETRYRASDFASLPYLEPTYLKEFHKGL
ncbi:MAG TPA: tRNA (adenosine(37)-N6)-threonylcarbamoyltransferase complex dimerization subunit type 1 TsaB [Dinghuibacter sp.]|uniref:tRNA (adenosine(37)-N6)-threonylcarbamoyltransferase complex dimerization subunit type 1 TsaB n=1 Tax=Dinghuibacter sp. TaxID=2024697 RepID=UPI002B57D5CC|nr:tRNA (adenosine(37)-N6)-threonylcarbamoyltransferase complex dimerization subunit type 1 TsaB [Dinghuibacter sp.]HTJ11223.1 tRNA (adenosine(37)-N6)-threonylcarbamoyltransferase complex dimerization subunit type 1 TsaB [Dinghuibacter sp.]